MANAGPDLDAIRAIVAGARAAGRTTLLEPEGLALLAAAGIAVPAWRLVAGEAEVDDALLAGFAGDRVVVKVVAAAVRHKTEVGGVAIVPRDVGAVRDGDGRDARPPPGPARRVHGRRPSCRTTRAPAASCCSPCAGPTTWAPVVAVGAGGILTEALAADLRPGAGAGDRLAGR